MIFWKGLRYRFEELGCRILVWGIPRLSRGACVRLARIVALLAFTLDRRGRAVALANLECAFGDAFTSTERKEIARQSYGNFVRTMLDLIWASRLGADTFRTYFRLEGFEELTKHLANGQRGAVLMCVHQGNWEWANLAVGFVGLQTTVVAEYFKNDRLTAIFSQLREVSGHRMIAQKNALLRFLRIIKGGGRTGMLIDLNLRPTEAATVINGFGLEMCVPVIHALLAERADALLLPVETDPLPDGTCRVIAHPPVEFTRGATPREIAQRCWDTFEPIVRARPGQYLWPYKHFRYKPENSARPFPFYANRSFKFDKLLRRERSSHSEEVPRARDI